MTVQVCLLALCAVVITWGVYKMFFLAGQTIEGVNEPIGQHSLDVNYLLLQMVTNLEQRVRKLEEGKDGE